MRDLIRKLIAFRKERDWEQFHTHKNLAISLRQEEREKLVPLVREIHRASRETYGTRRMAAELTSQGFPCDRYRAGTLMKLAGVAARRKRKFKATTDSRHHLPVSPNLLNREFEVTEPNRVWVSDISVPQKAA